jgi:hypothetical protein
MKLPEGIACMGTAQNDNAGKNDTGAFSTEATEEEHKGRGEVEFATKPPARE